MEVGVSLPEQVILSVKQGDRHMWLVTVTEDDGVTPIDLTGWTWELSAAKGRPSKGVFWTYTEADPQIDASEQAAGVLRVWLLPDDSRAFGKAETVEIELTGTAPGTDGQGRLSIVDGQINVRLEVAS